MSIDFMDISLIQIFNILILSKKLSNPEYLHNNITQIYKLEFRKKNKDYNLHNSEA